MGKIIIVWNVEHNPLVHIFCATGTAASAAVGDATLSPAGLYTQEEKAGVAGCFINSLLE